MGVFRYSPVDFLLTCLGLAFLLLDLGLDGWAVVALYREGAFAGLCFLLLFLAGSSVLVQAFSWLWYRCEGGGRDTPVVKSLSTGQLRALHVLQLGVYLRHAGVVEIAVRSFRAASRDVHGDGDGDGDVAVCLSHDLNLLRLVEAFSESAPQLVLMLAIILQRGQLDAVTVLKALGSASAIAFSMTMYHRSMRSFLPDKAKQNLTSSAVYFLWNLLLIGSRLAALSLFASLLPCAIVPHFLCSWLVLFFAVWWCGTDFMDSSCGEWLYRATVGLFWYFNWFNVVEGRTRNVTLLYHALVLADISLLCSLWCWKTISAEQPYFKISLSHAVITAVGVVGVYVLGLLFKMMYYKYFHPNLAKEELKGDAELEPLKTEIYADEVDSLVFSPGSGEALQSASRSRASGVPDVTDRCLPVQSAPDVKRCNKRMRKLAENFYS
ncbi:XK-related protein 8-like [Brachionichthys hirsutus]|uniref:XK-related protein 8-like n=1 Tax=Brachionichthys hirsutus TaxID=412623 RepID=UPI00360529B8